MDQNTKKKLVSHIDRILDAAKASGLIDEKNCGTGAGGFQPGNSCASGGSSAKPPQGDMSVAIKKAGTYSSSAGRLSETAIKASKIDRDHPVGKTISRIRDHLKYAKEAVDKASKKGADVKAFAKEAAIHHKSAKLLHDQISNLYSLGGLSSIPSASASNKAASLAHSQAHNMWRMIAEKE